MGYLIEMLDKASRCQTKEEAEGLIDLLCKDLTAYPEEERRTIVLNNLGYLAGYASHEDATRIYSLFGTQHPIFGVLYPTAEQAFNAGRVLGEEMNSGTTYKEALKKSRENFLSAVKSSESTI